MTGDADRASRRSYLRELSAPLIVSAASERGLKPLFRGSASAGPPAVARSSAIGRKRFGPLVLSEQHRSFDKLLRQLDADVPLEEVTQSPAWWWWRVTDWLNQLSWVFLLVGIIVLGVFIANDRGHEEGKPMSDQKPAETPRRIKQYAAGDVALSLDPDITVGSPFSDSITKPSAAAAAVRTAAGFLGFSSLLCPLAARPGVLALGFVVRGPGRPRPQQSQGGGQGEDASRGGSHR